MKKTVQFAKTLGRECQNITFLNFRSCRPSLEVIHFMLLDSGFCARPPYWNNAPLLPIVTVVGVIIVVVVVTVIIMTAMCNVSSQPSHISSWPVFTYSGTLHFAQYILWLLFGYLYTIHSYLYTLLYSFAYFQLKYSSNNKSKSKLQF